jgi:hypothetical protein
VDLTGTHLLRRIPSNLILWGINLRDAENLTQVQLDKARGIPKVLPTSLSIKKLCLESDATVLKPQ